MGVAGRLFQNESICALSERDQSEIREKLLAAGKLHADDTPVPVLDPGRGKTKTDRL